MLCSRPGGRPLIFSTELARSSKETIKHPNVLRRDLFEQLDAIKSAPATTEREKREKARKVAAFQEQLESVLDRSVAVFGAITVVTDGSKVVVTQKLERAVILRPEDPTINDHLGDAYWRVGRYIEAKFQWSHARDLDPEPENLDKILRKLEHGLIDDKAANGTAQPDKS